MAATEQQAENFITLTTMDNLDEQLGGIPREIHLLTSPDSYVQFISKEQVEQKINKERTIKKLIPDGYNPINLGCFTTGLFQNTADMKLVIVPGFDGSSEEILTDTIIAEFHNNCLPLIQNYMSTPENNTYSFRYNGWVYNFKFYWLQVATNKICFIGRNSNYKNMYTRCSIVEALDRYYNYSHIDDTGMLVHNDDYIRGKVSSIDPYDKAAFDSGLETLGTLAHKKVLKNLLVG